MSNLSTINAQTDWLTACNTINENNSKISVDIEKLKSATTKNKGYFNTLEDLKAAYTSTNSTVGMIAYVGTTSPYKIYEYKSSGWADTGNTHTPSVNLGNYYNKTEVDDLNRQKISISDLAQTTGSSTTTAMSQDAVTKAIEAVEDNLTFTNYVTCSTTNSTANKTVNILNFKLSNRVRLLIKMVNANTADNANLSISSPQLDTKPLYYNGERASSKNSWEAGAVLDVYYDGTNFQATDFAGGVKIEVDSELSESSENPVQNKVITGKLTELDEATSVSINAKLENKGAIYTTISDTFFRGDSNTKVYCAAIPDGSKSVVIKTKTYSANFATFYSSTEIFDEDTMVETKQVFKGGEVEEVILDIPQNALSVCFCAFNFKDASVTIEKYSFKDLEKLEKTVSELGEYVTDDRYIEATIDQSGRIIEATKKDGTKYIPKLESPVLTKLKEQIESGFGPYVSLPIAISFNKGIYSIPSGDYEDSAKYATSTLITDNFYLSVKSDYRIYSVSLFDVQGRCVNPIFLAPHVRHDFNLRDWKERQYFATLNLKQGYGLKVTICRADEGNINISDAIVSDFGYFSDARLTSDADKNENSRNAKYRARQIQNTCWHSVGKIAAWHDDPGESTLVNDLFYIANKDFMAFPYGAPKYNGTYIGFNCTPTTFLSAAANSRSLLYTEDMARRISAHGFDYKDTLAHAIYGIDCNSYVAYVLDSQYYSNPSSWPIDVSATKIFDYNSINTNNVKPLDLITESGHVSIIHDVLRDIIGQVRFIVWAEANVPLPRLTPYTVEEFRRRFSKNKCTLSRITGNHVISYTPILYTQGNPLEYTDVFLPNNDICSFKGDCSNYGEGDLIILNINRGEYTKCEIYKDNFKIHTESLSEEQEIDLDVSTYCSTYGNYKARLTNEDGSKSSDYTYYDVINCDITYQVDGDTVDSPLTVSFHSKNADPFYVEMQVVDTSKWGSVAGQATFNGSGGFRRRILTDEEKRTGVFKANWGAMKGLCFKIFVKTMYGIHECKKVF